MKLFVAVEATTQYGPKRRQNVIVAFTGVVGFPATSASLAPSCISVNERHLATSSGTEFFTESNI